MTPELVARELGWHNKRRADFPILQYERSQFMDLLAPLHRYVTIRPLNSLPATLVIRLRWNGISWKIDGDWGYGCEGCEGSEGRLSCWIKVG